MQRHVNECTLACKGHVWAKGMRVCAKASTESEGLCLKVCA